jgi:heptose II phosphotransferase
MRNASSGIFTREIDGYNVYIKDDGTDYLELWQKFRQGLLPVSATFKQVSFREVYLVKIQERALIFKIDRFISAHPEVRLWHFLRGPFHSRQMLRINRAVSDGCRATAEFFLVAERVRRGLARESWIIQEYFDGRALKEFTDWTPFRDGMRETMLDLHRHGLVLSDIGPSNWVVTADGVKAIDLTWGGAVWSGKAQDTIRMKNQYQVELPVYGIKAMAGMVYILAKHRLRDSLHNFRKPGNKKYSSR